MTSWIAFHLFDRSADEVDDALCAEHEASANDGIPKIVFGIGVTCEELEGSNSYGHYGNNWQNSREKHGL